MPIHPEGEDQSTESVQIMNCPYCHAEVAIPAILPVDQFACPECGEIMPLARKIDQKV